MNVRLLLAACLFAVSAVSANAQDATDIYMVETHLTGKSITVGTPNNITDRDGYDNQPSFAPDGMFILYTSMRNGQTDTYRYDYLTGKRTLLNPTDPEAEYSPTVMPDGKHYSVVRVEEDGTQRLWKCPLAGGDSELILERIAPVGYHAWLDDRTVALFVLGQPPTLQIADVETGNTAKAADNIGRCIKKVPGETAVSYTVRKNGGRILKKYNYKTGETVTIASAIPGSEDYCWISGESLVTGDGAKLYQFDVNDGKKWREVADFSLHGIKDITRLTVCGGCKRMAFVSKRVEK